MVMDNIMTVDVEEWFYANALNITMSDRDHFESRVVKQTTKVLHLLADYDTKATFFVLGCVAQSHPDLVKAIVREGHELASHGYAHQLVYHQSDDEFREDVRLSKKILEDLSGNGVKAYRAPSWSITKDYFHRLSILEEEGYKYDSSLQPFWTPLSGSHRTPVHPFHPVINGKKLNLIEVPPTVLKLAKIVPVPFSGGFYLRFMPSWLIHSALKRVNHEHNGMLYVHPWEFDLELPRIKRSALTKLIQYYHINTTEAKVTNLLSRHSFKPLSEVIQHGDYESVSI